MAISPNELRLISGGVEYPCILLPSDLALRPDDREAYLEYGSAHEPAIARVWMTLSQFNALPAAVQRGTGAVAIRFMGTRIASYDHTAPDTTLGQHSAVTGAHFYVIASAVARVGMNESIMEVRLASFQWFWQWKTITRSYNILTADKTAYAGGAVSSTSGTTYATVLSNIASDLGISIGSLPSTPTAKPHNLVLNHTPGGAAINRIVSPLGWHLYFDWFDSGTSFTCKAFNYADTNELADLHVLADAVGFEGNNTAVTNPTVYATAPASVDVLFPKYPVPVPASATDITWDRWTVINEPTPATYSVTGTKEQIFAGDHFDVAGKTYSETLSAIASERATAYYNRALIVPQTFVFAGGYNLLPGAMIRRVRITMDMNTPGDNGGWFTRVDIHGLIDVPRQDWAFGNRLKSPHFPEFGAMYGAGVYARDDGTQDMEPTGILYPACSIVSVGDDYLTCSNSTGTVYILKPYTLRRSPFHGQTVDGVTYTYAADNATRTANAGAVTEIQKITPDYWTGATIETFHMVAPVTLTNGQPCSVVDGNNDARAWAAQ